MTESQPQLSPRPLRYFAWFWCGLSLGFCLGAMVWGWIYG